MSGRCRSTTWSGPSPAPARPGTPGAAAGRPPQPGGSAVSVPESMPAAYITAYGGPEVIQVGRLPVPVPGPTDVLVHTELSAVNHVDTFVRSGSCATLTPFPFVIGRDLVGTVAATGPGVDGFTVGDRVWCNSLGHGGRQGSFAEYAVVAADRL